MKRAVAVFAVAACLVGVCAPRADAAPRFATSVVARGLRAAEPKIFVDDRTRPPTIYVTAPESASLLWRSADGGRTFRRMAPSLGGSGDSDVAVDDRGALYLADLFDAQGNATLPVSTSTNGGRSYVRVVSAAPEQTSLDRQWLASNRAGHVVATANVSGNLLSWVSTNGARSFDGPTGIAPDVAIQGPIVVGPRRTYYTIYAGGTGQLFFAKSRDGSDWQTGEIVSGHRTSLFPVIAADSSSNLYAVWSETNGTNTSGPVYLVTSTNGGRTWSYPVAVSPPSADAFGTVPSAVFPWVVAGSRGRAAVSYAIARQAAGPDLGADFGGPQTTWDLVVAQTANGLADKPRWTRTVVAPGFHVGSICTIGTACLGPQQFGLLNAPTPVDRRLLDFFGAGTDRAGNIYVALNRDRSPASGDANDVIRSRTDIVFVRQISGPRLR